MKQNTELTIKITPKKDRQYLVTMQMVVPKLGDKMMQKKMLRGLWLVPVVKHTKQQRRSGVPPITQEELLRSTVATWVVRCLSYAKAYQHQN